MRVHVRYRTRIRTADWRAFCSALGLDPAGALRIEGLDAAAYPGDDRAWRAICKVTRGLRWSLRRAWRDASLRPFLFALVAGEAIRIHAVPIEREFYPALRAFRRKCRWILRLNRLNPRRRVAT